MDRRRDELIELLETFAPSTPDAQRHRDASLAHVTAVSMPFDRSVFDPGHVTSSGFVLHPGGRAILMVLHRTIGRWLQPGGHVDPGDGSALEGSRREILEETGVRSMIPIGDGLIDVDVHGFPGKPGGDPPHVHFDLRFGFRALSDALAPSDEVADCRWIDVDELEHFERSIRRPAAVLLGLF